MASKKKATQVTSIKAAAKVLANSPVGTEVTVVLPALTQQLEASIAITAPVTPLTNFIVSKGYVYAMSQPLDEQNTAHGYQHEDGSAAMFIHSNTSTKVSARWVLRRADGTELEGRTSKEFAVALLSPAALPANLVEALTLLRKVTKYKYTLATLAGDANFTVRVQLLKKLLGKDKILVKESGINNVVRAFYEALNVEKSSAAMMAAEFETKCDTYFRQSERAGRAVRKLEQVEIKTTVKQAGGPALIHDDKPVLPGIKVLSAKKQAALDAKTKAGLAAQIANKRRQEEYTPLAVPRPEAEIAVNLDDVCVLEDPNNGITLLCLEKPNSQGAICVYNNGSRVAAGVLPTEILVTMRTSVSEDLIRDVNQLLHPTTAGVIVTPVAETHLTAVLEHCKETLMKNATETAVKTKKFEAPVKTASKKAAKTVAEKPAAKSTAKKAVKGPVVKTSATPRTNADADKKIVILTKDNPYREGTVAHSTYELARKSKTVGDFRTAVAADASGKYRGTALPWAVKQGHIKYA